MSSHEPCPFCAEPPDSAADGYLCCYTEKCPLHCVIVKIEDWNRRAALAAPVQKPDKDAFHSHLHYHRARQLIQRVIGSGALAIEDPVHEQQALVSLEAELCEFMKIGAAPVRAARLPDAEELERIIRNADGGMFVGAFQLARQILDAVAQLNAQPAGPES